LLSIAGHDLYTPKGVGTLYMKRGTPTVLLVVRANQKRGLRPGTENVVSTRPACHHVHENVPTVILIMVVAPDDALGSVRRALREGIEQAANALTRSWGNVVRLSARPAARDDRMGASSG
jgi:hypothetical protein